MMVPARGGEAASAAEAVARRSYGKLLAFLAARTRDVAAAEDALADAFAAALAVGRRAAFRQARGVACRGGGTARHRFGQAKAHR